MLGVGAGECGECLADGYYANAGELGCGDWAGQGKARGPLCRERESREPCDGWDGWCGW